ncbi:Structural maintenance of chromosomes protein 5 [Trametes pubescens]|uniref:Structural maintenance of chromosomes protein 5 n=1 Tax=Trametes pubescens TaxID=154538 RepID=A0A1M2W6Q3_TRAPU|nr:Structural maintenance of chromosomes protein 5 [Trametes pubescens]
MARRGPSHDSQDSLKENNGVVDAVTAHTKTNERVARGKRAAMRDHIDADDDAERDAEAEEDAQGEDDDEDEEDQDQGEDPSRRKRARVNTEGDSLATGSVPKVEKRRQTLPRDTDGFIPGSIVRIQLQNFLTYDWVEFRPGPHLNMIFGPNGTGKSSIACAICLGLNFSPALLARAPDLSSYVKNEKTEGYIEIELKGMKGKGNLVIRRNLQRGSKSAPFTLNGKSASGKEVSARMAELNVQVGNLCTFLPQDRVAEFARMTPQELLKQTQLAAGNEHLTAWHQTLISSGKELRREQELVDADKDQLKTMEDRNANLERDVRRYEERRALEQQIELLEFIVPIKEYYEAREKYRIMKPQQREALRNLRKLEARNKPYLDMLKALEVELKDREKQREALKQATKKKFKQMSGKWEENERLEHEAENIKNHLDGLKQREKNRVANIKKQEKLIADCEATLANPPQIEDLDDLNKQLRELLQNNHSTRQRQSELQEKQRENVNKSSRCRHEIEQISRSLHQLDSQSHQKLQALKNQDRDGGDVVEWLRNNKDKFRMEIFEPAVLCMTVPNRAYADAVEACFGGSQLKTFVAQCDEDYRLLNRLCVDTPEAIGRKARINTWYKAKDESRLTPPPASREELQTLGFDGYALDFVDCPEGLKWFLQSDVRLHRAAIALKSNVNISHASDMAARSGGASYIVQRVLYNVSRSKYGKRLPQTVTRAVNQARHFTAATVDPQIRRNLQRQLAEAQEHLKLVEEEERELSNADKEIQAAHKAYKEAHDSLNTRKNKVQDMQRTLQRVQVTLDGHRKKLDTLLTAKPPDVERNNCKQQLLTLASRRVAIVRDYVALMRAAIKEQEQATRAGLEYLQVAANKAALELLCKEQKDQLAEADNHARHIHAQFKAAKDESKRKLEASRAKFAEMDADVQERFQAMESAGEIEAKSAEEWEADLQQRREELDMNMNTNGNVVELYNKRKAEIETLTETIEEREKRILRIEQSIGTARENWQPALEKLVDSIGEKFSRAFDRIGCAGEIRIREDEDYDKWAIDIMVKFRDHEKLQLLTGERQSGGERSLTTILYLMSLTEEARAPFSLVDEINQGMDQRAERAVHNSLVEVTCRPESGQYFLITPKLLPDLNYHERMKILCVNNGEWLPEEKGLGNMMGLIDHYVRARQGRANASA